MVLISVPADESNVRLGALTGAEREAVRLAADGLSDRDIAALRGTTASTVSKQMTAAYRKLGLTGRRELRTRLAGGGAWPGPRKALRG
jgi:DNA-binding CsgD family transcriptional regulator